ncbi:MAG: PEP-CTERM sorting domain-containing protein [Candidatus Thiodiazotropha sp.]
MKKSLLSGFSIGLLLFGVVSSANADVLTFDDTSYQGTYWGDLDAGYGGFNWSNNFDVYYGPGISSAYDAGTVSGDYAAFNSYGVDVSVASGTFDWTGAWFNDPHNNTLLSISGLAGGVELYSTDLQLSYASPIWFQADWIGIDTIAFNVVESDWFTMDDFTFNESQSVAEPTTLTLLGLGLTFLGFSKRKKTA